jgi:hypothetical protein
MKISKHSAIIEKMTEMAKNPWIPAPLFVNQEEEEKVEKINEDIPINQVMLQLEKYNHSSPNESYLQLVFQLSNDKSIIENIKTGSRYTNMYKLDKIDFNYLHRRSLKFLIIEKTGFCCFKKEIPVAESLIKLDFLKNISNWEKTLSFTPLNSQDVSKSSISAILKIRNSLDKNEFITTSKTSITITKTFPPFKGASVDGQIDEELKPTSINKNIGNPVRKPTLKNPQNNNQKNQVNISNISIISKLPDYKMSDFKQEELTNPDFIDNLVSIKVLNFKIDQVNREIQGIEGRAPPHLREKLLKMKVKKNVSFYNSVFRISNGRRSFTGILLRFN